MADQQKIHPVVDVEAPPPPTAPLVPPGSSTSEKGHPLQQHPPPLQHTFPVIHSTPPKRSRCCKCLCWTISLLSLLLIILGATAGILYLVFKPKLPKYSIDSLRISDLRLNFDMSLYAEFDVKITAYNPNKKIGIYYEQGGMLSVWYTKTKLCEGSLPKFYQGHQNKTVLNVSLTGQAQSGSTLMTALQEQQQTGRIPLDLKVDAPVAIKLGTLKLRKVRILGECLLVVDSLSANNLISIKASNCRFKLKL
ncbi:Late embryogenesis abundant protein [Quillaja saponaria]|uniref:Late embryogenesis abundant protein n=1 Tax=Quillaja saponaria TaxID=32244 RepID=A0AAD7M7P9_QUISA|nr:Late embryogenesis abundant protein [Quillaja saponaria]